MDPIETIKNFMTKGMSPKNIVQNMAKNNPIFTNLITMADNGNVQGVENFARNLFKDKGKDFDKEFAEFKNNFR